MGAICNGIALSGMRPYGSGFLIFSDYMKPPIRLGGDHGAAGRSTFSRMTASASARTGRRTSRSSSWSALRAIPGLIVLRPADANEVAEAWRVALREHAQAGRLRAEPAGAADLRPRQVCLGGRAARAAPT